MEANLWEAARRLEPLDPAFVSVTYGAGGTTRERTHATVARLARETTMKPAAHLTCVGASKDEIRDVLAAYAQAGVRHIVALRGDPPAGIDAPYEAPRGRFPDDRGTRRRSAAASAISRSRSGPIRKSTRRARRFCTTSSFSSARSTRARPGRSPTSCSTTAAYFRFLDVAAAAGISIPIVPGIFPVQNFKQTANFARRSGASVPQWLADRFEGLEDDPATRRLVAAAVCAEQVLDLIDHGVEDLHFYTMNRADLVFAICHLIGLKPKPKVEAEAA